MRWADHLSRGALPTVLYLAECESEPSIMRMLHYIYVCVCVCTLNLSKILIQYPKYNTKGQANPCADLDRTWRFQEVGALRFQDNWHMNVVRLSALRTGRLYPLGTHFC